MSKLLALSLPPLIERICIYVSSYVEFAGNPDLQKYRTQLSSWTHRHTKLRHVEIPGWRMWGRGYNDCEFVMDPDSGDEMLDESESGDEFEEVEDLE
jgi:hypothetical protein